MKARELNRSLRLVASLAVAAVGCSDTSSGPTSGPGKGTADSGADPSTGEVRYAALGDSISQGIGTDDFETVAFPARLAERWRAKGCKVELKNLGQDGYTAGDIIRDEVPQLAEFNPTFITFQTGSNDIAMNVPIETYRTNVRTVLDAAKKTGARVVVLPQNEWPRSPRGPDFGGTLEKRNAYDAVMIEEVKAKGVELVDLRPLYTQHADKKLWAADGIHPTPVAYDEMAAEIARVIPAPCGK